MQQFKALLTLLTLAATLATGLWVSRVLAADLLVSSSSNNAVLRYDGSTGASLGAFVPSGSGGLSGPEGLVFGPDGHLYVTSNSASVLRYDGSTGAFIDTFVPPLSGGLNFPVGLTFRPDGHLYVSDFGTDSVLRYNGSTGTFIDSFVTTGSGGLYGAWGLVFDPDGHLYVSSAYNNSVLRYNSSTGAFMDAFVTSGSGGLAVPTGLVFGPDGHLYVNSSSSNSVLRYEGTTGAFVDVFVPPGSGGLNGPNGLTFGPDGNLYVSSAHTFEVLRYDGISGTFLDTFVPASSGGLWGPSFLIFTRTTTWFTWPIDPTNPSKGHYDYCSDWPGDPKGCYWLTDASQPGPEDAWRDAQPFQEHKYVAKGKVYGYHLGADYNFGNGPEDQGKPIYPTAIGTVIGVQPNVCQWGNIVFVSHDTPFGVYTSMYAHVDWLPTGPPRLNATVTPSQPIAQVGNGAWTKGLRCFRAGSYPYHLHFEIREGINTTPGPGYTRSKVTKGPQGQIDPNQFIATH